MSAPDYADFLFLRYVSAEAFNADFGSGWRPEEEVRALLCDTMRRVWAEHGCDVGTTFDELVAEDIDWLVERKALLTEGDSYTGRHLRLVVGQKNEVIKSFLANQDVSKRITALGDGALRRAIPRLAEEQGWRAVDDIDQWRFETTFHDVNVPASDRVVTLNHNAPEYRVLDDGLADISELIRLDNSQVIENPEDRPRLIEQFSAARTLISLHRISVRAALALLVPGLSYLAAKFGDEAIGQLASALLDALKTWFGIAF